jgi:hypothetical protein
MNRVIFENKLELITFTLTGVYCTPIKPPLPNGTVSKLGRISKAQKRPLKVRLVKSDGENQSSSFCASAATDHTERKRYVQTPSR